MSEQLKTPDFRELLEKGKNFAFAEITRKYGTNGEDGETPLYYHNLEHTVRAVEASDKISHLAAQTNQISLADIPLIKIGACFHDIAQYPPGGSNEQESAETAAQWMEQTGRFSALDIEIVRRMILGTAIYFDQEIMKQSAGVSYLDRVLADADLAYLGEELFKHVFESQMYMYEMNGLNPSKNDLRIFIKDQISLLVNHHFYTPEASILFPYQSENLAYWEEQLKVLDNLGK